MKRKNIKRLLWGIVLFPFALFLLVCILLYIAPIQNFVKDKVTSSLSESTGMDINVERIRLAFPIDLVIDKALATDKSSNDTLFYLKRLKLDVKLMPLLRSRVEVDGIDIDEVKVDTRDMLEGLAIKGELSGLKLMAHGIDLSKETVMLNSLKLSDADIHLCLADTTPSEDTTQTEIRWKIKSPDIKIENVGFTLDMPLDTMCMTAYIGNSTLKHADVDLLESKYSVQHFSLLDAKIGMKTGNRPALPTFDPANISAEGINIEADSVLYHGTKLNLALRDIRLRERSGLELVSAKGNICSDTTSLNISGLDIKTKASSLHIEGKAGMTLLDSMPSGEIRLAVKTDIGMADIRCLTNDSLISTLPHYPILAETDLSGSLDNISVNKLEVSWGDIFNLTSEASVHNITDSTRRKAFANLELITGDLSSIKHAIGLSDSTITLPNNMLLDMNAVYENNMAELKGTMTEGTGHLNLNATYDMASQEYSLACAIDSIDINSFITSDSISPLTTRINAKGKGFDFYDPETMTDIELDISDFSYAGFDLSGISLNGSYKHCNGIIDMNVDNSLGEIALAIQAALSEQASSANIKLEINGLDIGNLTSREAQPKASVLTTIDLKTDMKKMLKVDGFIGNMVLARGDMKATPKNININAYTDTDTTYAKISAGDLSLVLDGDDGVEKLISMSSEFSTRLFEQLKNHTLDYSQLRHYLPDIYVHLSAYRDNPLSNYMKLSGLNYENLSVKLDANRRRGIAGLVSIDKFSKDSIMLDTIKLVFFQDSANIRYRLKVSNNGLASNFVSDAVVNGSIDNNGGNIKFNLTNPQGESGLLLGCNINFIDEGLKLSFYPKEPIFFFRKFFLNRDNELTFRKDSSIFANIDLIDPNGMNFLVHSYKNERNRNTLSAMLDGLKIEEFKTLVPMLPDIKGTVTAEAEYTPLRRTFSLSGKINVTDLFFEKNKVMDIGMDIGYLPLDDDKQLMRAKLFADGKEVIKAGGKYQPGSKEEMAYDVSVTDFPLTIANPFIPDDFIRFGGKMNGEMTMRGSMLKPLLNGSLRFDSTYIMTTQYGARFFFENKPLVISDSKMKFDKFSLYTTSSNPFTIDGTIDFSDMSNMTTYFNLRAYNYELINAKRNKKSIAYGKAFIDANVNIKGPVNALSMNGYLKLLGNTNLGYVMKESPLTVQNRLGELVTFVNLNDTTTQKGTNIQPVNVGGMDILVNVSIDPAVKVTAHLSEYGNDRVELEGGGDLSLQYTSFGELFLSGRYTLSGGKLYYSLPIVSSLDFNVTSGSYVEWSGNAMNPRMDITAIKDVKADVTDEGSDNTRKVDFDVSISIKNTLENLGLAFNLSAPNDMNVQNQLSALGEEERAKQAITMLVTGRYGNIGAGGLSMGGALNSLLQTEISNITKNIKAVDISVGMESKDGSDDLSNMDYSFSLSKRFWNDRLNIIIGGKISSDSNDSGSNNESFIDNVSVEYRLDNSGTRYVKAFHSQDTESILEGEVMETGVGIVLRKKMKRMTELFKFGSGKKKPKDIKQ